MVENSEKRTKQDPIFSPFLLDFISQIEERGMENIDKELRRVAKTINNKVREGSVTHVDWEFIQDHIAKLITLASEQSVDDMSESYQTVSPVQAMRELAFAMRGSDDSNTSQNSIFFGNREETTYVITLIPVQTSSHSINVTRNPIVSTDAIQEIRIHIDNTLTVKPIAPDEFDEIPVTREELENCRRVQIVFSDGYILNLIRQKQP